MPDMENTTTQAVEVVAMHPFERAGLGKAPFRFVGSYESKFVAAPGCPAQPGSTCDYCGTGIMTVCRIRSADGRESKVGCDCIAKLERDDNAAAHIAYGDDALIVAAKRVKRDMARAAKATRDEAKIDAARAVLDANRAVLANLPHPHARPGETFADYLDWGFANAGTAWKVNAARLLPQRVAEATAAAK
jgi:hypothetical protein